LALPGIEASAETVAHTANLSWREFINLNMPRPTLLMAEPEPGQALSTRKLVLETGKFNVLTAHSGAEALDLFNLFPRVDLVILVEDKQIDCETICRKIKSQSKAPIVALTPFIGRSCRSADHNLSSHEPEALLELMRSLLGDPRRLDEAQPREAREA
jgi:CheY-like chemotaxis protein